MFASTTRLGPHRRYSPERPWEPLSDDEWAALAPFVHRAADAAGRPVRDPRGRLDAVFWLAAHTEPGRPPPPWSALPERFGKPDTASRQFRRWAKAGLWTKLLQALADPGRPGIAVLRRLESWICRAYRRAWRLLGVPGVALARRLGFLSALRGPSWLLPDPDLSEHVFRRVRSVLDRLREGTLRVAPPGFLRAACRLLTAAGGRRSIPRCLAPP
jgi:transposase